MSHMNSGRPLKKSRWFVVTQWNVNCDYEQLLKTNKHIRYLCYGEETCPSTGKPHHQMFIYLRGQLSTSGKSLGRIGKWFGETHCNVEPMRGTLDENEYYCSKESELKKFGEEPRQGCRDDLEELKEKVMKGDLTVDDICVEAPHMVHQYGRTLDRIEAIALRQQYRTWMTKCTWYTGPTASGKSHHVFEGYDPKTHYVKNIQEKWWDGYKGQPIVILNEFRGQIPFSEMCDLVDKWPKTVSWRCHESVPFLARHIKIASIRRPEEVYVNQDQQGEPWGQWTRRVNVVTLQKRKREDGPITQEVKAAVSRCADQIKKHRKDLDQKCSEGNNSSL